MKSSLAFPNPNPMNVDQIHIIITAVCTGFATVAIGLAQFFNARAKAKESQLKEDIAFNQDMIENFRTVVAELQQTIARYQGMIDQRDAELGEKEALIVKFRMELSELKGQIISLQDENTELKKEVNNLRSQLNSINSK